MFYRTHEAPETIIVETSERFLYLIQPNNVALRYGIGVGRDGTWASILSISRKAEWPDWTPPPEMMSGRLIFRAEWREGRDPLGARALYLGPNCVGSALHDAVPDGPVAGWPGQLRVLVV